jgi:hypothetical protein
VAPALVGLDTAFGGAGAAGMAFVAPPLEKSPEKREKRHYKPEGYEQ